MKRKKKKRLKLKFRILLFIIGLLIIDIFIYNGISKNYISSIYMHNNKIVVKLKRDHNYYCILSADKPDLDDNNWVKSNNKECILNYNEPTNLYIKNKHEILYSSDNDLYFDVFDIDTLYVPLNGKYNYFKYIIGNTNNLKIKKIDDKIASFNNDLIISGNKLGKTSFKFKNNGTTYIGNIVVTDLIINRTDNKEYLKCKKYSKEENDLLDEILKNRIDSVGYKTRAGVVEAARFLTLDFSYRIDYFYENGRQTTNLVDGEGRYYHEGLYLHESRFDEISGSKTGPMIWGCPLYSNPAKRDMNNGLDCSGFVSWALLNGGFDVKDVGAGFSENSDLTDFGELKELDKELALSNTIKVGDLLHSEAAGGHIGIIIGIDKDNYYVAQALWYDKTGVVITEYKKDKLPSSFPHVVLMDKYYKNDGYLTNLW